MSFGFGGFGSNNQSSGFGTGSGFGASNNTGGGRLFLFFSLPMKLLGTLESIPLFSVLGVSYLDTRCSRPRPAIVQHAQGETSRLYDLGQVNSNNPVNTLDVRATPRQDMECQGIFEKPVPLTAIPSVL